MVKKVKFEVKVVKVVKEFEDKLPIGYRKEYKEDTLLVKERRFKFANKNGVFNIEILSFDGKYVKFEVTDEKSTEIWTIDNFYIIDDKHLEKLFNNAKEYDMKPPFPEWEGVYILHDNEKSDKYYVGQSININERLKNHLYCSRNIRDNSSDIDKRLNETNDFELKCIRLKNSGYSNLNALETAFIAYLKSYFCGYNKTRGNMAAQKRISSDIDKKINTLFKFKKIGFDLLIKS